MRVIWGRDKETYKFNTINFFILILSFMKKIFNRLMACTLVCAAFVYTSCTKDLQNEIAGLDDRLTAVEKELTALKTEIEAGAVISDVQNTANGVKVTLSNGKSFELKNGANGKDGVNGTNGKDGVNGTNGTNGKDGKNGSVITLDPTDGTWIIDGVDTNKPSQGAQGAQGEQGPQGPAGAQGAPGEQGAPGLQGPAGDTIYYAPENGVWVKYVNGKVDETYKGESIYTPGTVTAVWNKDNGSLELYGVDGVEAGKPYVIAANSELNSLAFVPTYVNDAIHYPTTKEPFKYIAEFLTESKYDKVTFEFVPQDMDASNSMVLPYRVNPTSAKLDGYAYQFVNRVVETRAAGDATSKLIVADFYNETPYTVANGELSADVRYNISEAKAGGKKYDLVALQAVNGNAVTTSDYITVDAAAKSLVPVLYYKDANNKLAALYERNEAIVKTINEESSEFIQQFALLTDPANFTVAYDKTLDLKPLIALYDKASEKTLASLDFHGIKYTYSLPLEYLADDNQKTNQQWFVELADGVLDPKASLGTSAIGRTPVVRVDAFVGDNNGVSNMVASAYVKIAIVDRTINIDDAANIEKNIDAENNNKKFVYHNIKADWSDLVAQKPWEEINTELYAATETSSSTFWGFYGGDKNEYTVTLTTTAKDNKKLEIGTITGYADGKDYIITAGGVQIVVNLNDGVVNTSNIKVNVNNTVKTQNTYKDINGNGAEYVVTVKIKSDNKKIDKKGDITLTQTFYVKDECKVFDYNPLYWDKAKEAIVIKGQLNSSNTWELSSMIREHFVKISNKNIFEYCTDPTINQINIESVDFALADGTTGVSLTPVNSADAKIALSAELATATKECTVEYVAGLVNGEECEHSYDVIFVNPFKDGSAGTVTIVDAAGTVTGETMPLVKVVDDVDATILSYDATVSKTELTPSKKANETYKLAQPAVKFAFDTNADGYKEIMANKSDATVLKVNETTGQVTWKNEGSALKEGSSYEIPVICTVTYKNLSVIKCKVNVVLKAAN